MAITKKEFNARDTAPAVLYGKRDPNSLDCHPLLVDPQGGFRSSSSLSNKQQRVSYNSNRQTEYIGEAERGVAEGDSSWIIHKLEYNSNKQYEKRTVAIDASWTDRVTADYS